MGKYDRQIARAKRTITAKGRACLWREMSAPGVDNPVSIVFFPEGGNAAFLAALTGTDINIGDDYGLMPAVGFLPTTRGRVYAADGETMLRAVKRVIPFAPDGTPILYTIKFAAQGAT